MNLKCLDTDLEDYGHSKIKDKKDVKENGNGKVFKNFQGTYYNA